jgi:hypothetical protein
MSKRALAEKEHREFLSHAVALACAFIENGDLRHDGNYRDDKTGTTQEQVTLLLIQMYRCVAEASFEARQFPWAGSPPEEPSPAS